MKILAASESVNLPTGFAIATRHLATHWADAGHEVVNLGWQYQGHDWKYYENEDSGGSVRLVPNGPEGFATWKPDGTNTILSRYFRDEKPDLLWSLTDIWLTESLARDAHECGVNYVNYFPIDAEPADPGWVSIIKNTTVPVCMSKYGVRVLEDVLEQTNVKKRLEMVYHGVDTENFRPYSAVEKEAIRKRVGIPKDAFVIGFVGRNCTRKQLPRLLAAFDAFAADHKDVLLVLHVGSPIDGWGWNLPKLIKQSGYKHVQGRVLFTGKLLTALHGVTDEKMADIYSLMDLHASATSGEGFGIPTLEAMACGVPNVITDYTTSSELVGGRGWLVPVQTYIVGDRLGQRAIVDISAMTAAFQEAYDDRALMKKYSRAGVKFAEKHTWKAKADEFMRIFEKL